MLIHGGDDGVLWRLAAWDPDCLIFFGGLENKWKVDWQPGRASQLDQSQEMQQADWLGNESFTIGKKEGCWYTESPKAECKSEKAGGLVLGEGDWNQSGFAKIPRGRGLEFALIRGLATALAWLDGTAEGRSCTSELSADKPRVPTHRDLIGFLRDCLGLGFPDQTFPATTSLNSDPVITSWTLHTMSEAIAAFAPGATFLESPDEVGGDALKRRDGSLSGDPMKDGEQCSTFELNWFCCSHRYFEEELEQGNRGLARSKMEQFAWYLIKAYRSVGLSAPKGLFKFSPSGEASSGKLIGIQVLGRLEKVTRLDKLEGVDFFSILDTCKVLYPDILSFFRCLSGFSIRVTDATKLKWYLFTENKNIAAETSDPLSKLLPPLFTLWATPNWRMNAYEKDPGTSARKTHKEFTRSTGDSEEIIWVEKGLGTGLGHEGNIP
ncbi:hypothetical protein AK812_SmicGene21548 [Symbiodinium microadriaticum]|uniref:Uncharacterized protein n=1 Tax=Symbiodinium microadriaticum TaxID=2951 RepID=A0A1Q9DM59_SYMMI|nr:hypothetical protein AK812_SmicGene21548 [Symbiodinium microadriaticum]